MAEPGWRPRLRWGTPLPGLLPADATASGAQQPFRQVAPFLRLAFVISLGAGFGVGAVLAISQAWGVPLGAWWTALVQVHGRAQLVGFVGLFILAVGLHFLPRLRGAPLVSARSAQYGLLAIGTGVLLQAFSQPLLALASTPASGLARVGLVLGGVLAWLGSTLIVAALARTLRHGPPLSWRGGLMSILPFLILGFSTLWLTLLAGAALCVQAALAFAPAFPAPTDRALTDALLFGFALPVSVAVSARLLPITFGVELVAPAPLLALFAILSSSVVLRVAGDLTGQDWPLAAANLLMGLFGLGFPLLASVPLGPRRPLRRADSPALAQASRLPNALIRSAYVWLLLAGALALIGGLSRLLGNPVRLSEDALRHAVTVGYLTLLILGMGARLIPGFARLRLRPVPQLRLVVVAGNLAALFRVLPPLAAALGVTAPALAAAFGLSGLCALLAVGRFTQYVWPMLAGEVGRDAERNAAGVAAPRGQRP